MKNVGNDIKIDSVYLSEASEEAIQMQDAGALKTNWI